MVFRMFFLSFVIHLLFLSVSIAMCSALQMNFRICLHEKTCAPIRAMYIYLSPTIANGIRE